MKRFSTVRDTQRGSGLHEEEEREEGDGGEQEEKKGDSRGERQIYAVVCSQSVLCSSDTHKDSQNWIGKRELRRSVSLLLSPTFSPPAHLYLPPPSPLFHVTL